ncbi:MAG: glycosyltransferase family 1 protein, partial [Deltaproteobacteria bacterium]
DRGGACEMVEVGRTGLVARAGDVTDLRNKIVEMLHFPDETIAQMGRNAREKLEKEFHPDILYPRLLEAYEAARRIHAERRGGR